jgi:hypothetical protein
VSDAVAEDVAVSAEAVSADVDVAESEVVLPHPASRPPVMAAARPIPTSFFPFIIFLPFGVFSTGNRCKMFSCGLYLLIQSLK